MEETCNLGDMYSYWENSTVNSSAVAENWIVPRTLIIFMYCYLSIDVRFKYSIKFLTCLSQSLMSPINTPVMGDGDECQSAKLYDVIVW